MKALHRGCDVLSQIAGFFSAAEVVWPVMGEELMWRALEIADRSVSSDVSGPKPGRGQHGHRNTVRNITIVPSTPSGQTDSHTSLFLLPCSPSHRTVYLIRDN